MYRFVAMLQQVFGTIFDAPKGFEAHRSKILHYYYGKKLHHSGLKESHKAKAMLHLMRT